MGCEQLARRLALCFALGAAAARSHAAPSSVEVEAALKQHGVQLNDKTLKKWLDLVRPHPDEVAWKQIPWRPTFWDAVQESKKTRKPILVWAMNGHPLACT